MRRVVVATLMFGCSPHAEAPKVPPSKASISSVQLLLDCGGGDWPEPEPEPVAAPAMEVAAGSVAKMEMPADLAAGGMAPGLVADSTSDFGGCQQSQVMMAFTASTVDGALVELREVRLMFDGQEVGTMTSRKARIWKKGNTYERWDRRLVGTGETKASWDLADPPWNLVEGRLAEIDDAKAKGTPDAEHSTTEEAHKRRSGPAGKTWGRMFTLEADVVIDGISQTVKSSEFVRQEVHMVVT